jgi:hypothetical protein
MTRSEGLVGRPVQTGEPPSCHGKAPGIAPGGLWGILRPPAAAYLSSAAFFQNDWSLDV